MTQTGILLSSPLQTKLKKREGEMPKEIPVPSNRTRVSPYPLRSTRTKKEPIEAQGPSQWEDVLCVICQEAPHNAILLRCFSSSTGCRAYMCDTSVHHSNCFKQYRKKNMNRVTKVMSCPYCRGEVYEAMKVPSGGRRALNAKARSCTFENCNFSGTYSQLKNHLKDDHLSSTRDLADQGRQRAWEQMQIATGYNDISTAAGLPQSGLEVMHPLIPNVPIRMVATAAGLQHSGLDIMYQRPPSVPPRLVIVQLVNGRVQGILCRPVPNSLPHSFVIRGEVNGVMFDYLLYFNEPYDPSALMRGTLGVNVFRARTP